MSKQHHTTNVIKLLMLWWWSISLWEHIADWDPSKHAGSIKKQHPAIIQIIQVPAAARKKTRSGRRPTRKSHDMSHELTVAWLNGASMSRSVILAVQPKDQSWDQLINLPALECLYCGNVAWLLYPELLMCPFNHPFSTMQYLGCFLRTKGFTRNHAKSCIPAWHTVMPNSVCCKEFVKAVSHDFPWLITSNYISKLQNMQAKLCCFLITYVGLPWWEGGLPSFQLLFHYTCCRDLFLAEQQCEAEDWARVHFAIQTTVWFLMMAFRAQTQKLISRCDFDTCWHRFNRFCCFS